MKNKIDVKRDDIDRILEIAKRYGVKVYLSPGFPRQSIHAPRPIGGWTDDHQDRRGLTLREWTKDASYGPMGHRTDVQARVVWFDYFSVDDGYGTKTIDVVQSHLHEICHVICQPPGGRIEQLSEDVLLMPFERTIARQFLSRKAYKKIVSWQLDTQIEWPASPDEDATTYSCLEDVPCHEHHPLWLESFAALRKMGAIKNGRVTWKPFNWKRCPKRLLARGNFF